ncbi:MAG: aminotransferase class I/II-fold pyridoxal phosphate-dependent enzyme [Pseudomonadota bacterium]|nr:aminotransferase class I/II-fold pyridoxal phosphate-dependent enzyme [Pseudomonadota bacterium]
MQENAFRAHQTSASSYLNHSFHPLPALHGGPDALGVPAWDLSTNANACGPYVPAVQALREADARHYPDPAYIQLSVQLAAWHHVAPERIVLAASGSEFIQRISTAVALHAAAAGQGAGQVWLPAHAYGDYARAAHASGLHPTPDAPRAALLWACEPSSPLGQPDASLPALAAALQPGQTLVLDQAYAPLRLSGTCALAAATLDSVWRLITPNKALGLTGVRAAYAIAPAQADSALLARVQALSPSWPVGAHGVALLQHWASIAAHDWLHECRATLRQWKTRQTALLAGLGWQVLPSDANFFVAAPTRQTGANGLFDLKNLLPALRARGIKLRDCASFGLPGHVRLAVVAPEGQDALVEALKAWPC